MKDKLIIMTKAVIVLEISSFFMPMKCNLLSLSLNYL